MPPVSEIVRFVDQDDVGVGPRPCVKFLAAEFFLGDDARRDRRIRQFGFPHLAQARGTNYECLLSHVISEVFEQLLPDPCLSEPDRIGDYHAIVTRQYLARLLDRVFLKLRELDGGARSSRRFVVKLVLEVLVQRLHVDFGGVYSFGQFRGVEQIR